MTSAGSNPVRTLLHAYLDHHPDERAVLRPLLTALDEETQEGDGPGITCGAVVVDRDRRVLHVRPGGIGPAVIPGRRVRPRDAAPAAVALGEVEQRTGLRRGDLCHTPQYMDVPIDIAVPESTGRHYDIRFLYCLAHEDPVTRGSGTDAHTDWLPLDQVSSASLRTKLLDSGIDGIPQPVNASALIFDGGGRYLLHLRDNHPQIWEPGAFSLLGGGREIQDRSLEDTLRRELREEAGLDLPLLEPFAVEGAIGADGLCVPVQVFAGRWTGDPDTLPLTEGVLLRWFRPEMLHRLRLSPSTRELVHRHAARRGDAAGRREDGARPPGTVEAAGTAGTTEVADVPGVRGTVPNVVGAHLYLEDDEGRVLLGLRHPDSAYAGSTWHFPAGHCEQESAVSCLVREAREETGLVVEPADVEFVHLVHIVHTSGSRPRMQLVFRVRRWQGTPEVREPDKCLAWQWWSPDALPEPLVPYTRKAIEAIGEGRLYTEMGWGTT